MFFVCLVVFFPFFFGLFLLHLFGHCQVVVIVLYEKFTHCLEHCITKVCVKCTLHSSTCSYHI